MKQKTLYVCDIDGTLLNRSTRLTPRTIEVFSRLLADSEMHLTFATARSYHSAVAVLNGITPKMPLITGNGCFIHHPVTGERLQAHYFTQSEKLYLSYVMLTTGASPFIYAHNGVSAETITWATDYESEGMRFFLDERYGDERFNPVHGSFRAKMMAGDVFTVILMDEKETLEPFYNLLQQDGRFNLVFQQELYRPEYWLYIQSKKADKGQAALLLKEKFGLERIVAFGDSPNDEPLFQIADEAYAVADADPALKKLAKAVIGSNEEDAVAEFLYDALLKAEDAME